MWVAIFLLKFFENSNCTNSEQQSDLQHPNQYKLLFFAKLSKKSAKKLNFSKCLVNFIQRKSLSTLSCSCRWSIITREWAKSEIRRESLVFCWDRGSKKASSTSPIVLLVSLYYTIALINSELNWRCKFSVPFDEDEKDKSVWFLDHDYLESMYGMFKKVNARERVVGQ